MAERNPHESWGDGIGATYREQLRKAKEADAIPFGQERLSSKEARDRFTAMSEPERQKFIAEKGEEEILRMLKG